MATGLGHANTISGYISNATGTAWMGVVFFFPIQGMWRIPIPKGLARELSSEQGLYMCKCF